MTSVGCYPPLSLPSSSSFTPMVNEKRRIIRKNSEFMRRKALFRLAARRIKWAKRTVTLRDIRSQIDKEFEELVFKNQKYVNDLQSQNDELRQAASEMFNKCSSLLTCVETFSQYTTTTVPHKANNSAWIVPGSDSSFSDSDSESSIIYLPQIELKKSIR